jgi:hypothetical protein
MEEKKDLYYFSEAGIKFFKSEEDFFQNYLGNKESDIDELLKAISLIKMLIPEEKIPLEIKACKDLDNFEGRILIKDYIQMVTIQLEEMSEKDVSFCKFFERIFDFYLKSEI